MMGMLGLGIILSTVFAVWAIDELFFSVDIPNDDSEPEPTEQGAPISGSSLEDEIFGTAFSEEISGLGGMT